MNALVLAYAIPKLRLTAATVLLGVPGHVLAETSSDIAQTGGWVAIIGAVVAGLVTLLGAVADFIVKITHRGSPTTEEIAWAEEIRRRAKAGT